ncbi:hypothetical protein EDEG_02529 [Edhazardia aedis USNM 41457]|uniref:Uncharacterized protein n=1 Tax=Edhazardia aedis (strain USNM 41457) TaxID=1003232 RepID=J9D5P6_EDHAE|nr:hypothetical protein EDEG_02529 [Edhazardia aedis USNM 41457]|eukprot:EJW03086.1 hypothetical protein EDEG_02529 [Edhazardia aedis USNM 41457]
MGFWNDIILDNCVEILFGGLILILLSFGCYLYLSQKKKPPQKKKNIFEDFELLLPKPNDVKLRSEHLKKLHTEYLQLLDEVVKAGFQNIRDDDEGDDYIRKFYSLVFSFWRYVAFGIVDDKKNLTDEKSQSLFLKWLDIVPKLFISSTWTEFHPIRYADTESIAHKYVFSIDFFIAAISVFIFSNGLIKNAPLNIINEMNEMKNTSTNKFVRENLSETIENFKKGTLDVMEIKKINREIIYEMGRVAIRYFEIVEKIAVNVPLEKRSSIKHVL